MTGRIGLVDSRPTGSVYKGEAAQVAYQAARLSATPPAPARVSEANVAPPVELDAKRPLPYPEPVALNDNSDPERAPVQRQQVTTRLHATARRLAWLLILPLYVAVALAAIGIDVLFVKDLMGL